MIRSAFFKPHFMRTLTIYWITLLVCLREELSYVCCGLSHSSQGYALLISQTYAHDRKPLVLHASMKSRLYFLHAVVNEVLL